MIKQRNSAVLQINQIAPEDSGVYAFQLVGKGAPAMATLNIDSKQYDLKMIYFNFII